MKIRAALGLIILALLCMAASCETSNLPPGIPCFPGVAECGCYVKEAEVWVLRVCPSAPASTPPSTPPTPCPGAPPCPCGEKADELWLDQCGVAHPVCQDCQPPSPPPATPTPPASPPPSSEPSPAADGCFPPTKPHGDETMCPWGACLSTCPPVANYGIYFERITRGGKEVCRGHLGNPREQVPGCFFYAEKQGKSMSGDHVSFGMTPRGSNAQRDPVTGKDSCCWYGDGRGSCELPTGCPAPAGEFRPVGYTGTPCKTNDPFSITCYPASKGWKMFACPPDGMINPVEGVPFRGTQGCNQRVLP